MTTLNIPVSVDERTRAAFEQANREVKDLIVRQATDIVRNVLGQEEPLKERTPGLGGGKVVLYMAEDFTAEDPEISKMFYGEEREG